MLIAPRRPDPDEMGGGTSIVTVLAEVERGLRCDQCGQDTRVDTHVRADETSPIIATLTGCTACRTGLYGAP